MALFNIPPDFGVPLSVKPRVLTARFGDGYQQRVGDGIHTREEQWALTFSARTPAEAEDLLQFFEARDGVEAFSWTSPRGTAGFFVCTEWGYAPQTAVASTITAKFEQVFEPGVVVLPPAPSTPGALSLDGAALALDALPIGLI